MKTNQEIIAEILKEPAFQFTNLKDYISKLMLRALEEKDLQCKEGIREVVKSFPIFKASLCSGSCGGGEELSQWKLEQLNKLKDGM